ALEFFTHQIVIVQELVAIVDEEVGTRALDANADDRLGVLPKFANQGRKIRIAAKDDKGIEMLLRVTKIERINHHPNIRRILARLPDMRDFNQFKSCLMEVFLKLLVAVEIAIRLLDDYVAAQQKALQDQLDVESRELCRFGPQRDILQVQKHRHG